MRSIFCVVLVFLLCPILAVGQNSIEDYKKIIDSTTNNELKLASLDSLINLYKKERKLDLSSDYTEQYVAFALENEAYEMAMKMVISQFYIINTQLGQRERALKLIALVEPHLDKTENTYYKGGIYLKKGGAYVNGKDYQKGIEYYSKAIELYGEKDSIHVADATFFRGQAYFDIGDFMNALESYEMAGEYYQNLGDQEYAFYTSAEIISIYGVNGFTEKAIEERNKMIQRKLDNNFFNGLSVDHYNQHSSYKKLGDQQKMEENLLKALEYAQKENNYLSNIDEIYVGLSKFYAKTDLKKSKSYLDQAEEIVRDMEPNTFSYQNYKIAEGYYLNATGRYSDAIGLYKSAINQARKSKSTSKIMESTRQLSHAYDGIGDYKNSITHYKAYVKLKDSVFNRTKTNALAFYQTLYETEKKEAEILKQQRDIEVLAAQNER